ncbi:MAG: DNA polymerase III subunit delta [Muribaculaceae bacterium]|nr:DNA polymerase III subunit delta [Muribaculaceae bacterium]
MADVITFSSLTKQLKDKRDLADVYLLHGEEGYYIDRLVEMFENLLPEEDRDFNLTVLYGPETDPDTVMDACRRYPMMVDRQIVILKEAQSGGATFLNAISKYIAEPSDTTIFVIAYRGAEAKGKDLTAALKKSNSIVFESKRLTDKTVGPVILEMLKENNLSIEPKALEMLRDYVGTDLSRLYNEIEKLTIALPAGAVITPEAIEQNIGISKDYNNFELINAIANRNYAKAMTISKYFRSNPKNASPFQAVPLIFNLFSNLLAAFYAKDKSDRTLMAMFGFRSPYQLIDIKNAMRNYSAWQTIEVISELRRFDTNSKGIGSRMDTYDLFDNLIFKIMTAPGKIELKA